LVRRLEERGRPLYLKKMRAQKRILSDMANGCLPIVVGFILAIVFCLLISLCSCRAQQKTVEVERWAHDTTTVVDTVHVRDVVVQHDSIVKTEFVYQWKHDTINNSVAYKYYTYNEDGSIKSLLDYVSQTAQGSTAQNTSAADETSVSGNESIHDEKNSHSESAGSTTKDKERNEVKPQLTKMQRFLQGMGYTFIVLLALGLMFGGMSLYGKRKRL
jgi:hypothetical protein